MGLAGDRRGNFALWFALTIPVIGAVLSFVIDLASVSATKSRVQTAADAAALSLAQLYVISTETMQGYSDVSDLAYNFAVAQLESEETKNGAKVVARVFDNGRAVEVTVSTPASPFTGLFRGSQNPVVLGRAVARLTSSSPLCVLALNPSTQAIRLTDQARADTGRCIVQSNSKSANGITARRSEAIKAGEIRSGGGFSGPADAFRPTPIADYPPLEDPLRTRPAPPRPNNPLRNFNVTSGEHTIQPGAYRTLIVGGTAKVTMEPGIYYITQTRMSVASGATLKGEYVGIYLEKNGLTFEPGAVIDLKAPKDGPMAGMLIWRGPGAGNQEFKFNSAQARNLLGTIYLPDGGFISNVKGRVADESAYTVIVAKDIIVGGETLLVINSDYDATDVPVPMGLGDTIQRVRLAE